MSVIENGLGIPDEVDTPTREPRGSRRRPGASPPKPEKIPPRSKLSRAEVRENQRSRIFRGLADALAYHGYEDTKVTDVVELAGVSRATFYERFEGKEACFDAAYADGIERLSAAVEIAVGSERDWANRLAAGLLAGLRFLSESPARAQLLLVESLAAARPARLEHERSLERLAHALRPPPMGGTAVPEETARLLAGGLASHLSRRVLAGEAERLPGDHELLLDYLLAPIRSIGAAEQRSVAPG